MKEKLVAVVGRPNVGKSTFFNRVVGSQVSIVEDVPGVTRDRIYGHANWAGHFFTLVDTGGLDFSSDDEMQKHITAQAQIACDLADVIVFFVDGSQGLTRGDVEASEVLRKTKKPVIVAVNKLDEFDVDKTFDFYSLGLGEVFPVSSLHSRGVGDLLDAIVSHFGEEVQEEESGEKPIKIAIVGKPNAGKSSLTNRLIGENRVVVSSVAGTTRDSVEIPFRFNKKDYIIIDTAGMRRKSSIEQGSLELFSVMRSLDAVRKADVVLLMVDCEQGLSDQDLKIASFVAENFKPFIILMNKWDLIEKDTQTINKFNADLEKDLAFMPYYKAIYISAKTGQRTAEIVPAVEKVFENANRRISTGTLNDILHQAFALQAPPSKAGKRLKLLYATQSDVTPPTFTLFVNNASICPNSYLRYIENYLRKSADFEGVPIKIKLKNRSDK